MKAIDRYRVLCNIVAQKGIRGINLYAELAKAENMVNVFETQAKMPPQPSTPQATMPQEQPEPDMGQQSIGKYDNL